MKTHPRCWHWRSPAHGQCFLGPSSRLSQDRSSITWLGAPKQRSRSIGLAEQTGKSRTENTNAGLSSRGASQLAWMEMVATCAGLYLCGRHSRGRGCSRSGAGRRPQPLLWLHCDCIDPTHTAVRRSTPHPSYKTGTGKKMVGFFLNVTI